MRLAATFLALAVAPVFGQSRVPIPGDTESSLEQGVQMFREGKYPEAISAFQRAVDFDPSDAMAHLYLGIAHTTQYFPGTPAPASADHGQRARSEFLKAIEIAPANKTAFQYLASLSMREAQVLQNQESKFAKFDEAREWYRKLLVVDPKDKEAYFSIGVIAWMKCNPELMNARARIGPKPQEAGPLEDAVMRQSLKEKYSPILEDGIANLNKALQIDPSYEDAMTYLNLLIRARADLRDSMAEYQSDLAAADEWLQKSNEIRELKARSQGGARPRIRAQQAPSLLSKVEPEYPAAARQARIEGTVRFTAIIGGDGRVLNLQLVSGHPLLVAAAQAAVKKWVYKPTLLNGRPAEVVTQVEVNFVLPAKNDKDRDRASSGRDHFDLKGGMRFLQTG